MENISTQNHIEKQHESKERLNDIVQEILFVRHGATTYKEQLDKNFDGKHDLTDVGVKQIEDASEYIGEFLNKDKTIKIFNSPRVRAKNSAEIMKQRFEAADPTAEVRMAEAKSLMNTKVVGNEVDVWTSLMAEYAKTGADMTKEYFSGELNNKFGNNIESPDDQSRRIKESFEKMLRIIRKRDSIGKDNENIVLVGHNETLHFLLQSSGQNLTENDLRLISTGETAHMQIFSDHVIIKFSEQEYRIDM